MEEVVDQLKWKELTTRNGRCRSPSTIDEVDDQLQCKK
jgi:hypothetical protein